MQQTIGIKQNLYALLQTGIALNAQYIEAGIAVFFIKHIQNTKNKKGIAWDIRKGEKYVNGMPDWDFPLSFRVLDTIRSGSQPNLIDVKVGVIENSTFVSCPT